MVFVSLRLLGWSVVQHYLRYCDHYVAVLVSHRFYVIPQYKHRRRLGLPQSSITFLHSRSLSRRLGICFSCTIFNSQTYTASSVPDHSEQAFAYGLEIPQKSHMTPLRPYSSALGTTVSFGQHGCLGKTNAVTTRELEVVIGIRTADGFTGRDSCGSNSRCVVA